MYTIVALFLPHHTTETTTLPIPIPIRLPESHHTSRPNLRTSLLSTLIRKKPGYRMAAVRSLHAMHFPFRWWA